MWNQRTANQWFWSTQSSRLEAACTAVRWYNATARATNVPETTQRYKLKHSPANRTCSMGSAKNSGSSGVAR